MVPTHATIRKQKSDENLRRQGFVPISAKVHFKDKDRIKAWIKEQNAIRRRIESKGRAVK